MATQKLRNPWWFRPFNLLYKWFGIVVAIDTASPDYRWRFTSYRLHKRKK